MSHCISCFSYLLENRRSRGSSDLSSLRLDVDGVSKQDVTTAVDGLPEIERLVVSLYFVEELTIHEIASVLSLSETRVFQFGLKAMKRVRTHLDHALVNA